MIVIIKHWLPTVLYTSATWDPHLLTAETGSHPFSTMTYVGYSCPRALSGISRNEKGKKKRNIKKADDIRTQTDQHFQRLVGFPLSFYANTREQKRIEIEIFSPFVRRWIDRVNGSQGVLSPATHIQVHTHIIQRRMNKDSSIARPFRGNNSTGSKFPTCSHLPWCTCTVHTTYSTGM